MTLFGPQGEVIGGERFCRGCGCSDSHACIQDGFVCTWVLLDVAAPTGVCSACAEDLDWDPRALIEVGTLDVPQERGAA